MIKKNKNQIKSKREEPKLKPEKPVKINKQKRFSKKQKLMLTIKNGLALFKKGLERESNRLDYL